MNNLDIRKVKEIFARIFVLAFQNKMNLRAFTNNLERSELATKIEKSQYDDYFNKPIEQIFFDITNKIIEKDTSFGVFDVAYWCGYSYFELQNRTKKSFAFIFLKLTLEKMVDLYPIYHEMDFSSLLQEFNQLNEEKTILRLLCEDKKCSLQKLSSEIEISKTTLSKYNASDEALYKGSFQAICKIATYFDTPISMFRI